MADTTDFDRTDRPRTAQPPPVPNDNPSIHLLVANDLKAAKLNALADDMTERAAFGYRKYGTLLQSGNGRDAASDAYEEILDYLAYIKQQIDENKEPEDLKELYVDYMLSIDLAERSRRRAI